MRKLVSIFFFLNIKLKEINRKDRSLCKDIYIYIYIQIQRESTRLDTGASICVLTFLFFIFFQSVSRDYALFSRSYALFSGSRALFMGPTNTLFRKKKFKTGSHSTIHIFKNYVATVFLVFNFQQNKLYPNRPVVSFWEQLIQLKLKTFC